MRIVHIAPNSPFNDGWGYQDNLLPKYQKRLKHQVTLIITNTMHCDGKIIETEVGKMESIDGFDVIRLPYRQYPIKRLTSIFSYMRVYEYLVELQPDFVFFHGLLSCTIFDVIRYKLKKQKQGESCVIVQDNHLDYNIGIKFSTTRQKLLRLYYRILNCVAQKYVDKVYAVTPWRKTYAEDYFGISQNKTDVLIMGADDEKIDFAHRNEIRKKLRRKFQISDEDFLIVTGGKIDNRKNVLQLMEACKGLEKVKLVIFGNINDDIKERMTALMADCSNIKYIGWVNADKVYNYFFAADLVFFPGQHSVLWEQACACKVPCTFLKWEGMEHVNAGGNASFISEATVSEIRKEIIRLCFTSDYYAMKNVAESDATDIFLYSHIAEKSIECGKNKARG